MRFLVTVAAGLAAALLLSPQPAPAGDLVRELLRQQSAAERSACGGVQRALASGAEPALVVRTAVELGYGACQVLRCAVEGQAQLAPVIRGAAAAGVEADVIARCCVEAGADAEAVAVLLSELLIEPNYCYFAADPVAAPEPLPPLPEVFDRSLPPRQASPFTF